MIVLTLAAVGVGSIWAASYSTRLVCRPQSQNWTIVAWAHDGQGYAFGIRSVQLHNHPHGITWRNMEGDFPRFAYRYYSFGTGRYLFFLTCPVWAIAGTVVAYPAMFIGCVLLRRYSRRWQRKCLKCGYNLRGNVSGRCPECGKPIPPKLFVPTACAESRMVTSS